MVPLVKTATGIGGAGMKLKWSRLLLVCRRFQLWFPLWTTKLRQVLLMATTALICCPSVRVSTPASLVYTVTLCSVL